MADTRISKIKLRQGDFDDLPMLDPGELGYAKDQRRLFIGNDTVSVGTGDGIVDTFTVDADVSSPNVVAVFLDGTEVSTAIYGIVGTTLTFATAPAAAAVITINFNSEIEIDKDITRPSSLSLGAGGTDVATGFQFNTTQYNACIMDYTIESTAGVRIGQLRFAIDQSSGNVAIDDNYTGTSSIGITFSLNTATADTLKLMYTDADTLISKFKYTYQLWNSN
jgi:hypothetical protein|tara:strand:+ start:234 stop:899 length:666 start_codon:yes stop_codon:yes gene_type:complete